MGLFNLKKKKAEKQAAQAAAQAQAAHAAATMAAQRKAAAERTAAQAAASKRAANDQKQEMAITEMRSIKEKIALWQKKVDKLNADKKEVLGRLAEAKKRGMRMNEADKRKLAKINKDIKLTQGQLETLESKLSGIEQAAANVSVVDTIEGANTVTEKIAKPVDEVQDVLQKAEEQRQDLEEANMEFLLEGNRVDYDEDELLEDLKDFELQEAYESGAVAAPAAPSVAPTVPTKTPAFPSKVPQTTTEDDEIEAEMRRQELKSQAV